MPLTIYLKYTTLRWKPPIIFVRLNFLKCVQICIFFKSEIQTHIPVQIFSSEYRFATEKVYRFSQVCLEFDFNQNVNLDKLEKIQKVIVCRNLRFEENANLNTLEKIQTDRNYWGFPPLQKNTRLKILTCLFNCVLSFFLFC